MSKYRTFAYVGALARAVRLATRPGGPPIRERLSAVPRMVTAVRRGEYHDVSAFRLALIAAGAAYVVSPVDLLPEGVLGVLGLADDAMVLGWVTTTLVEETEKFIAWEHRTGRAPAGATPYTPPPASDAPDTSTVRSDVVG
jgi:uncharacterized membrane protein YkvA (DUF1232 family)